MGFAEILDAADLKVRQRLGETEPLVYTSGLGEPVTVVGIFDLQHQVVDLGQAGVDGYAPAAFVALADLTSDPVDDEDATITARGVVYAIHQRQKTADQVLLILHRAT